MSTTDDTSAARQGSESNDLLGLVERLRFLASGQDDPQSVALTEAADKLARCGGDNCMGRRCDDVTNWVTEQAAQARVAAERERWAKRVRSMCAADLRAGPGFYGDDAWIEAYKDLANMAGVECGYLA